jgi:hypothetical protein
VTVVTDILGDGIPIPCYGLLSHRPNTTCVYHCLYTCPRAANRPCDGRHQKRECDTNFFVCLLVRRYRIDALALPLVCFAPHCGSRTFSAMRNEHSVKDTPRPPRCPSCGQIMRLARITSRFGDLPDLYTFECRACGVSHIEPGLSPSIAGALQLGARRKDLWTLATSETYDA